MKPTFLSRLPRLRWRPGAREPLVKADVRASAPALEPDFDVLEVELLPTFYELDEGALRAQNDFRLGQLLVIVGGAAATALGAVQAALGGGVIGIGIAEALVAGVLAAVVSYVRGRQAQREYFTGRLKAERLRGEYFFFLGRVAPYDLDDDEDRRQLLHNRVVRIEGGEEPG
jgi:Protein of unknown function (DUF4231)